MITAISKIEKHNSTYTLARPKSMILTLFVTLLTHRIFSGWNSLQTKQYNSSNQLVELFFCRFMSIFKYIYVLQQI